MAVQVYGCNHVVIEVDDAQKAVEFYSDVFNLEMLRGGEGAAWCKLGEHQFLAIFEVETLQPDRMKHFGIMVRDEEQVNEVRDKLVNKYGLTLEPPFRCDFRDPWETASRSSTSTTSRWCGCCPTAKYRTPGFSFHNDLESRAGEASFGRKRILIRLWFETLTRRTIPSTTPFPSCRWICRVVRHPGAGGHPVS